MIAKENPCSVLNESIQAPVFKLLIGGELVDGASVMTVINPASGDILASCPRASAEQVSLAVESARTAFAAWSRTPLVERRDLLRKIADVMERHASELGRLLTQEQGKPLADAMGEVLGAAGFFRHTADANQETRLLEDSDTRHVVLQRRPLGVVAVITAWNFPLFLLAFKVPQALLTGNTVVVKPPATTPLTTLLLARLIANIVPRGVINVVSDCNDLGDVLTGHPHVAKVSFTGSTATGYKVMANAAKSLKRVTLELGGNDAGIVLDDADPAEIAPGIFRAAFFNSGQACIALKRLYVHTSKYEQLCAELAKLADAAVVGDGLEPSTTHGPLQNRMQYEKMKGFLADAREHGRIMAGGKISDGEGFFLRPTIVADIEDGTRVVDEEQFGPILPVIRYSDLNDAIARANAGIYGLGASVWSSNPGRAAEVANQLVAGTVWINQHIDLGPHIPQAGAKQSGLGVELGEDGLLEFTQVQVINVKVVSKPRNSSENGNAK